MVGWGRTGPPDTIMRVGSPPVWESTTRMRSTGRRPLDGTGADVDRSLSSSLVRFILLGAGEKT